MQFRKWQIHRRWKAEKSNWQSTRECLISCISFLRLHKGCVTKLIIKNVSRPEKYILKIRGNNFVRSREINLRLLPSTAFLPRGLHIAQGFRFTKLVILNTNTHTNTNTRFAHCTRIPCHKAATTLASFDHKLQEIGLLNKKSIVTKILWSLVQENLLI